MDESHHTFHLEKQGLFDILVPPDFGGDTARELGVGAWLLALLDDALLQIVGEFIVLVALLNAVHRSSLQVRVSGEARLYI